MKKCLPLILIALLMASPAFADTAPSADDHRAEERQSVQVLLANHHELPERSLLDEAADDARQIVTDIATDEEVFRLYRQRALMALGYWADEESYQIILEHLEDDQTPNSTRHLLMPVLGEHFAHGEFEERTVDTLESYLFEADDPHLRISAAKALNHIDSDTSVQLLRRALEVEEVDFVRERIAGYARTLR